MSYLIDSDYVADFLKGRPDAILLLSSLPRDQIAISVITFGEVTEGITFGQDRRRHEQGFRQFLRIADVLPLSRIGMRRFANIRGELRAQGELIPDMDLLIGATAIAAERALVTRNRRHFTRLQAFGLTLHP
jgi:predicted nucleic acid-binding protein